MKKKIYKLSKGFDDNKYYESKESILSTISTLLDTMPQTNSNYISVTVEELEIEKETI